MNTFLALSKTFFNNSDWFTYFLNREKRYIVALTNNNNWFNIIKLIKQLRLIKDKNKTIWGWTSPDKQKFIDVWVTTNSLNKALRLAKKYNQQAIWDNISKQEIFI